ncbi:unnamed protein product [Durusdinium trenchii]|uniref:Uncharacterized protein n=1 Tax=Durusdinium trenchii TaxID=1381693 RepID=A0ABP0NVP6_9DINO
MSIVLWHLHFWDRLHHNVVYMSTTRSGRPVESRLKNSKEWTKHSSIRRAAAALDISTASISACINQHQASACGYEFRLATPDILSGEEWRCLDLPALLQEKATRKGR